MDEETRDKTLIYIAAVVSGMFIIVCAMFGGTLMWQSSVDAKLEVISNQNVQINDESLSTINDNVIMLQDNLFAKIDSSCNSTAVR